MVYSSESLVYFVVFKWRVKQRKIVREKHSQRERWIRKIDCIQSVLINPTNKMFSSVILITRVSKRVEAIHE